VIRVLVDTDVCLDLLANRQPFALAAANLFSLADRRELIITISSLTFSHLHYLLSKTYSRDQARKKLTQFKTLVSVLAVDDKVIEMALQSDFKDFEDAIQYYTALRHGVDILLTRNIKDYKSAQITVLTPEAFLSK
jgi:predicted nucleic acid-binding protein